MMLPDNFPTFRDTNISRPQTNILCVRWILNPTSYPLEDINFEIFRSNSPAGPFDHLGTAEPGQYGWTDYTVLGDPAARQYYYIVRAASVEGRGFVDSAPFMLEHSPDNIAFELVRKKNIYLTVRGGVAIAVLIRKTWGAKCGRCWNKQRMAADDPDCPSCFGTGFAGGPMNPVFIPALFNPPKQTVVDAGLIYEPYNCYIEMANHPILSKNDMVVDRVQNLRFNIVSVNPSNHRMHPIAQVAQLNRLDENDIRYTIEVPEPPHANEGRSWDMVERWKPIKGINDS